jgi:hypothetical protein
MATCAYQPYRLADIFSTFGCRTAVSSAPLEDQRVVILALNASREAGEEIRGLPEMRPPATNLLALGGRVGAYYAKNISVPDRLQQENPRKRRWSAAAASGVVSDGGHSPALLPGPGREATPTGLRRGQGVRT